MTCNCALCVRLRSIRIKIKALPEEYQAYFTDMVECMLEIEFDNDYYRAILSSEWPGAKEILTKALEKCK